MGEQQTLDAVGKEVGVAADLLRGHPKPREIQSQKTQLAKGAGHDIRKDLKVPMAEKIQGD